MKKEDIIKELEKARMNYDKECRISKAIEEAIKKVGNKR